MHFLLIFSNIIKPSLTYVSANPDIIPPRPPPLHPLSSPNITTLQHIVIIKTICTLDLLDKFYEKLC